MQNINAFFLYKEFQTTEHEFPSLWISYFKALCYLWNSTHLMQFFQQHMGSKDDFQAKIEEQTNVRLDQISESVKKNKEEVIQRLLTLVYDIKPELHQNLRT